MHTYTHTYTCARVCVCLCVCVACARSHMHACLNALHIHSDVPLFFIHCLSLFICTRTHTYTHAYMHAYIHVRSCTVWRSGCVVLVRQQHAHRMPVKTPCPSRRWDFRSCTSSVLALKLMTFRPWFMTCQRLSVHWFCLSALHALLVGFTCSS